VLLESVAVGAVGVRRNDRVADRGGDAQRERDRHEETDQDFTECLASHGSVPSSRSSCHSWPLPNQGRRPSPVAPALRAHIRPNAIKNFRMAFSP
jgi:hypothetical protein